MRIEPEAIFQYVDTTGANLSEIQKKLVLKKGLSAPLKKGTTVGKTLCIHCRKKQLELCRSEQQRR